MTNWRAEQKERDKKKKAIEKEIAKLNKEHNKIGTTDGLEIIREKIEEQFAVPARIRRDVGVGNRRLVIFSPDATDKQIRYGRPEKELGSVIIQGCGGELSIFNGKEYPNSETPDTVEEIYHLIIDQNKRKTNCGKDE